MSAPERRAKVERVGSALSVRRQCALLNVARSGVYFDRVTLIGTIFAPSSWGIRISGLRACLP